MNRIVCTTFFALVLLACREQKSNTAGEKAFLADGADRTTVQWLDSVVHFGTINQGEKAAVKFRLKNTGSKPLLITHVRAGCGCTVADYTKEAIAPGAEGVVTAAFNSNRSQAGHVRKTVVVHTNSTNGNEHTLIFTGNVKELKVTK